MPILGMSVGRYFFSSVDPDGFPLYGRRGVYLHQLDFYGYVSRKVAQDRPLNVVHLFAEAFAWRTVVDTQDLNPSPIQHEAYATYFRRDRPKQSADNT